MQRPGVPKMSGAALDSSGGGSCGCTRSAPYTGRTTVARTAAVFACNSAHCVMLAFRFVNLTDHASHRHSGDSQCLFVIAWLKSNMEGGTRSQKRGTGARVGIFMLLPVGNETRV